MLLFSINPPNPNQITHQQTARNSLILNINNQLPLNSMNKSDSTELEAATFRRLLEHLDSHKEVQNIDLMILANFCRNCLSKW